MNTDDDWINVPSINNSKLWLIPTRVKRGVAKEMIAAKGNNKAIYALSLKHRMSLQACGYLSRTELKYIDDAETIPHAY